MGSAVKFESEDWIDSIECAEGDSMSMAAGSDGGRWSMARTGRMRRRVAPLPGVEKNVENSCVDLIWFASLVRRLRLRNCNKLGLSVRTGLGVSKDAITESTTTASSRVLLTEAEGSFEGGSEVHVAFMTPT